jgi:hypothetical protein
VRGEEVVLRWRLPKGYHASIKDADATGSNQSASFEWDAPASTDGAAFVEGSTTVKPSESARYILRATSSKPECPQLELPAPVTVKEQAQ